MLTAKPSTYDIVTFASCEFIGSYYKLEQLPNGPNAEIALFGRSNVGKSSLINSLAGKSVARVSKAPGKTQSLNYYLVNNKFYVVDVPGYGFAKTAVRLKDSWRRMVNEWMFQHDAKKSVLHILDGSLPPQDSDIDMMRSLDHTQLPRLTVVGKTDKIRSSQRHRHMQLLTDTYGDDVIVFSSVSGEGRTILTKRIYQTVQYE